MIFRGDHESGDFNGEGSDLAAEFLEVEAEKEADALDRRP